MNAQAFPHQDQRGGARVSLAAPPRLPALLAGVFEVDAATAAAVEHRAARAFALSAFVAPSLRLARSPGEVDGVAVHLVGADRLEGRMDAREVSARTGDLVFHDLGESADLAFHRAQSDAADLLLWLPRARLPRPLADFDSLHGLTISHATPAGALIGAALVALRVEAARATDREFDALAEGVLALIAAASVPALATPRAPLSTFLVIRRHIDKNLAAPGLDAAGLARTFGLSRASLYRLFEPVGGVAAYIRAARLRRAYQEIADPAQADRRIGPIAYGLGFKNVSAFNRLFRSQFGVSPRDLRAGRAPAPGPAAGDEGELTLRDWLRRAGAAR
ncbi:MAG: helix-turn-helix domain-containing protein [Pseudomonadota bacterium]|nr:helix-turn-helix domain-containing protein [Pseudomonadota bacterium]